MTGNSEDYATANLAALNRAEALAGKWEADVARLDALAALKTDPAERIEVSVRAQALQECAHQLREAIKR
jgi:hypothetical protein